MYIGTSNNTGPNGRHMVLVRFTDEEAAELVAKLSAQLQRRKAMIEVEPSLANWNDVVFANGELSIGICAEV
jgi:hypothetical protein